MRHLNSRRTDAPKVSVIVPLYNATGALASLVRNLQRQTLSDFEVLLVDDGSTDDTLDLARKLTARDGRFAVLHQENAGPGEARNTGLDAAQGTYVVFLDDDDIPARNLLKHACRTAEDADADIVIWQTRHTDVRTGETYPSPDRWDPEAFPRVFDPAEHAQDLFGTFRNWPWDKMFRRGFLEHAGLRFPPLYRTEDLAFTCSALACASRIALLDEELYTYRVFDDESSTQTRELAPLDFIESCKLLRRFLQERDLWGLFHGSYIQWVGLCAYVNLMELRSPSAFARVYTALHDGGLEEMDIANQAPEAYRDERVAHVIDIVQRFPAAEGSFIIFGEAAKREESLRLELEGSRTYRMGRFVLAPARGLRFLLQRRHSVADNSGVTER